MGGAEQDEATRLLEEHEERRKTVQAARSAHLVKLDGGDGRRPFLYQELARCGSANTTWLDDRRVMEASSLVRFSGVERAELLEDVKVELDHLLPWPTPSARLLTLLDISNS